MNNFNKSTIDKLKEDIIEYETACREGNAQHMESKILLKKIQSRMEAIGLDYCTVNLIKLGSEKYSRFEKDLDCSNWVMNK